MIRLLIILALLVQVGCSPIGPTMIGSFLGHLSADMVYDKIKKEEEQKKDKIKKEEEQKKDKLNIKGSP